MEALTTSSPLGVVVNGVKQIKFQRSPSVF